MKGIYILSKHTITETPNWVFIVLVLMIILLVLCFVSICTERLMGLFVPIGIASFIIICILIRYDFSEPTNKYEYKAIIDDSVSFNYLYDKYEIINKDGKIFTIRDK